VDGVDVRVPGHKAIVGCLDLSEFFTVAVFDSGRADVDCLRLEASTEDEVCKFLAADEDDGGKEVVEVCVIAVAENLEDVDDWSACVRRGSVFHLFGGVRLIGRVSLIGVVSLRLLHVMFCEDRIVL